MILVWFAMDELEGHALHPHIFSFYFCFLVCNFSFAQVGWTSLFVFLKNLYNHFSAALLIIFLSRITTDNNYIYCIIAAQ